MTFEESVLKTAIEKMFSGNSFSICDLDKIGKLMKVNPSHHPNYTFLSALHCVDFKDMDKIVIDQLQQKVVECLRPKFNSGAMAKALLMEGNDHFNTEDNFLLN
jgi:hypothetical protein|tara:strand:- start:3260 stop:3571 length:312 start_codon:yes stop_codon:yes gene_type:complete